MAKLTLQQLFDLAVQRHQAGRLNEAEQLYRQILAVQPNQPDVLHHLGVIAHQVGRHVTAMALIRQSITLKPDVPEAYSNLGLALKDNGMVAEAIDAYRQAIALKPDYPEAWYNLGIAHKDRNEVEQAIVAYRRATNFQPNYPQAFNNLGAALKDNDQLDEAILAYGQAVALLPQFPEAHNNLGVALKDSGRLDEAIAACRRAIALRPTFADAHGDLGTILHEKGQLDEAIDAYRQAISLRPDCAQDYVNLGGALNHCGQLAAAIAAYRQAIALKPDSPAAHSYLGLAFRDAGEEDAAVASCLQAISLDPLSGDAQVHLAAVLNHFGRPDEAIIALQRALLFQPQFPEALSTLAACLKNQGKLDAAIAAYHQAIALRPDYTEAHSNLLYVLHYHPRSDAAEIAKEHARWKQQHAEPLKQRIQTIRNDPNPDRRLRIGYVSPDFREHVVGRFILPVLEHNDKSQFEVFAYSEGRTPDAMSEKLRSCTDGWRSISGLSDSQVADFVRHDQIDILVDLAMHTAHNRLLVFAEKPAPVQVTYLAYCSTTGMETIDYRISDPYLDAVGEDESIYSEVTIRLPETYWCYQRHLAAPSANALPANQRGYITFGCLNNFSKVSEPAVATWIRLLKAVPTAQLLLHALQGSHRQELQHRLQQEGLDPHRLLFAGRVRTSEYFCLYNQIDIALDPFPYGGGTTTCDALWMGVPVVSLIGKTAVGRGGLSILSNIGLPELAARTQDEYVRISSELAGDLPRLDALRFSLRRRMLQSPLMDAPRFGRNVEAAYRQMWQTWCAKQNASDTAGR